MSTEAHALRYLFLAEKTVFHLPSLPKTSHGVPKACSFNDIKIIGVVGSGLMGTGIAISLLMSGFSVILYDISTENLKKAVVNIGQVVDSSVRRSRITEPQAKAIKSHLLTSSEFEEYGVC